MVFGSLSESLTPIFVNGVRLNGVGDGEIIVNGVRVNGYGVNGVRTTLNALALTVLRLNGVRLNGVCPTDFR